MCRVRMDRVSEDRADRAKGPGQRQPGRWRYELSAHEDFVGDAVLAQTALVVGQLAWVLHQEGAPAHELTLAGASRVWRAGQVTGRSLLLGAVDVLAERFAHQSIEEDVIADLQRVAGGLFG